MAATRAKLEDLPEMLELGLLIGRVRRRLRGRVQLELEARGTTLASWAALRHLASAGPSTQREIAEATAQHPAHISRQLAELEKSGLLRRSRDPDDRRCLRVGITGRGRRTLALDNPAVAAGIGHALSGLAARELTALRTVLRKVLAVEPGAQSRPPPAAGRRRGATRGGAPRGG
ncbi:MAG: hypothetical protein NVSMB23_22970 [Myxococcales bacterium]